MIVETVYVEAPYILLMVNRRLPKEYLPGVPRGAWIKVDDEDDTEKK